MPIKRRALAVLLFALWAMASVASAQSIVGEPLLRHYGSDQTRAAPGHLALANASSGELFSGNAEGVLRFNGIDWELTLLPGRSPARSLATGADGRIYVGGYDTFGRLAPDGHGGYQYEELLDAAGLVGEQRHLEFVYETIADDHAVWFRTDKYLHRLPYDGGKATHWPLPPEARSFYRVDDQFYVRVQGRGLTRFDDGRFTLVPGGEAFARQPLISVLHRDDGLLLVGRNGLHRFDGKRIQRLDGPASELLDGQRSYVVQPLADGSFVVGTLDGDLIRIDRDLRVRERVDLGTHSVVALNVDREGGLWAATENDLVRIALPSPWSHLGESQGISGSPSDFEWYDGALWLATSQGIQRLTPGDDGPPKVERLGWTEFEAYSLLATDHGLLAGVREGLKVLDPGAREPRELYRHPYHGAYSVLASRHDPGLVYAVTGSDLLLLRAERGRWQIAHTIPFGSLSLSGLEEGDAGELWLGDTRGPVQRWRLDLDKGEIVERNVFDDSSGLAVNPQFGTSIYRFEDRIHAISGQSGFRYEDGRFVADVAPPITLVERRHELQVADTPLGTFAYTTRELWQRKPGEQGWRPVYPGGRGLAGFTYLRHGKDDVLRIATWSGLLQFDPRESAPEPRPLQLAIESVVMRDPRGTAQPMPTRSDDGPVSIAPGNSLSLRFAMVSMESGAEFRYLLHGVTPEWSAWADRDLFVRALPAGDYVLEVQARTGTGRQPPSISYRFQVQPRWYEQWWMQVVLALALFALAATFALWLVRQRTARYLDANRRLEARIAERTQELEDVNRRLAELATEDALTGVANRRALENGLRREWFRCLDQRRPLSVLMIDVDHFKAYNDAHGHLEGDLQLRGIAQHLNRHHDSQRELLARYGGEEFALLLPGVHVSEALRRAEAIRASVASSDAGMTVSIGVAGAVPEVQAEPDSLLRRADAALYAAKRAGRNRVEADGAA